MARIQVTPKGESAYRVEVHEGKGRTVHDVTLTAEDLERFASGVTAERLIEESFRFLLEREDKESILGTFALPVIARYFPEYSAEIRKRLG